MPPLTRKFMSETVNLEIGDKAPAFSALDNEENEHKLTDLISSGKKVILYFYPRDSTPGCTVQACDFRDNLGQLSNSEYVVLGVSKDSAKSHGKFIGKQELNFPLLMDEDGSALIIHEAEDDHISQPIGGAGGRVACAVISGE